MTEGEKMSDQRKSALVTGASSGIGMETARKLAEKGIETIVVARRMERLETLAQAHEEIVPRQVDLTDPDQVENFCTELSARKPPVTILVNNAGYSIRGMFEAVPLADIRRLFEVNVFALVRITQACLPGMRRARMGTIINVSSIAGKFAFPGNGPYTAAKHAVEAFTDALRHEVAPFGIRVVALRPAFIATEFNTVVNEMSAEFTSRVSEDYQKIAETAKATLGQMWADIELFEPGVVADVITQAIFSNHPNAAYAVGPMTEEFLSERARLDDDAWRAFMDKRTGLEGLSL